MVHCDGNTTLEQFSNAIFVSGPLNEDLESAEEIGGMDVCEVGFAVLQSFCRACLYSICFSNMKCSKTLHFILTLISFFALREVGYIRKRATQSWLYTKSSCKSTASNSLRRLEYPISVIVLFLTTRNIICLDGGADQFLEILVRLCQ